MGLWGDRKQRSAAFVAAVLGFLPGAFAHAETPVELLVKLGVPAKQAERSARHIPLGLPGIDQLKDAKHRLLVRNGYILSYDTERNALTFALAVTEKADLGNVVRQRWMQHPRTGEDVSVFRPDPTLKGLYQPTLDDFHVTEGYTRGHAIRSRERTSSIRENRKTFVYSNQMVQAATVNNGPWQAFEDFYLDYAHEHGLVPVHMLGQIWGKPPVTGGNVAVASEQWKVVVFLRPGQTADTVDETNRVIAIRVPNNNVDVTAEDAWSKFRVAPKDIEAATGLDLFSLVRPHIAEKLRSRVDDGVTTTTEKAPQPDLSKVPMTKPLASGVRGTLVALDEEKQRGTIRLTNGHEIQVHRDELVAEMSPGTEVLFDLALRRDGARVALKVKHFSRRSIRHGSPHRVVVDKRLRFAPAKRQR